MQSLSRHPFFTRWTDDRSGMTSYVLDRRVAPLQKNFYFTHSSVSVDERILWFYAGFPPNRQMSLGAVGLDPEQPWICHFPAAGFESTSVLIAPDGTGAYFTTSGEVWFQPLEMASAAEGKPQEPPRLVGRLPEKLVGGRLLFRTATHVTLSSDGRLLLLDGRVGHEWFVGTMEVATGEFRLIRTFAREFNHAQFSPVDPTRFVLSQDHFRDPVSGRWYDYDHRIWMLDTEGTQYEPLRPGDLNRVNSRPCHEWWTADGRIAWVDYERGVYLCDPAGGVPEHVWARPLCHAHADPALRWWCADQSPYRWPDELCQVLLLDRASGKEYTVVTAMPPPTVERAWYHIDPHPQFSPTGRRMIYTTTSRGMVDVALVEMEEVG